MAQTVQVQRVDVFGKDVVASAHDRQGLRAADERQRRARYCRLRAWFDAEAPRAVPMKTVKPVNHQGRMLELVVDAEADAARGWLTEQGATRVDASALSLEDIFLLAA